MVEFIKNLSDNFAGIQNIIAAIIAGVIAVWYNYRAQNLNREKFSRELIKDFESRYLVLRRELVKIEDAERDQNIRHQIEGAQSVSDMLEDCLFDPMGDTHPFVHTFEEYLALCSSQYYWWKRKYIEDSLWEKWAYGMSEWYKYSETFQYYLDKTSNKAYDDEFLKVFTQMDHKIIKKGLKFWSFFEHRRIENIFKRKFWKSKK